MKKSGLRQNISYKNIIAGIIAILTFKNLNYLVLAINEKNIQILEIR